MSTNLFSWLRSTKGQASLRDPLGKWRQEVSRLWEQIGDILPLGQPYDLLQVNATRTKVQWADSPPVYVAPLGTGADDWPRLGALMQAYAYKRPIALGSGTWVCKSLAVWPSGTYLIGNPGVVIDAQLGVAASPTNAPILAQGTYSVSSTTLAAAIAAGAITCSVNALVVGDMTIAVGSEIIIQDVVNVWKTGVYTVLAISGPGPYTLTLSRPVFVPFTIASKVAQVKTRVRDVTIAGNGMVVSGTCDRYIEFANTENCIIQDLTIDDRLGTNSATDYCASYDVGGYRNVFRNLRVDAVGVNAASCLELESNEDSTIERCTVKRNLRAGIELIDCWNCHVEDCQAYTCTRFGISISGETVGGSYATAVKGCTVEHCAQSNSAPEAGVYIDKDSSDTVIDDATVKFCGSVVGISGGVVINDTAIRTTITKARCLNCASFAGILVATATALHTTMRDVNFDGCLVGFVSYGGDYLLDGFRVTNSPIDAASGGGVGVANSGVVTSAVIKNGYIEVPNGNGTYGISWPLDDATARMHIDNVHISLSGPGTRVGVYHKTGVCYLTNVLVDGPSAAANFGLYTNGGTLRLGIGIDVGACGTPVTGIASFGTVVANGTGAAQAVSWPDIKSTDHVSLTLQTPAGAPGFYSVTKTPGTGFSATFAAGDTSTYEYGVTF